MIDDTQDIAIKLYGLWKQGLYESADIIYPDYDLRKIDATKGYLSFHIAVAIQTINSRN